MMTEPVLRIENLQIASRQSTILQDIALDVRPAKSLA